MPGRLQDKVAIVTGSAAGIGRQVALTFHREGATVVCSDLRESTPGSSDLSTHDLITKEGGKSLFVKTDVTKSADVEALVDEAVKHFGKLDIMINNAGISAEAGKEKPVWELDEDIFDLVVKVNLKGTLLGIKYASRQMVKQEPHKSGQRGWIVNLGSIYGLVGEQSIAGYVSSKHAVIGLTKTAALDCAPHRINVNAVCPGYLQTAMTQAVRGNDAMYSVISKRHVWNGGGFGEPKDVANVILFLSSEENTWMTGAAVPVDGGYVTG